MRMYKNILNMLCFVYIFIFIFAMWIHKMPLNTKRILHTPFVTDKYINKYINIEYGRKKMHEQDDCRTQRRREHSISNREARLRTRHVLQHRPHLRSHLLGQRQSHRPHHHSNPHSLTLNTRQLCYHDSTDTTLQP